jgi:DnaJ like chaperone protein
MQWKGKVIGAVLGTVLGRIVGVGPIGAAIGVVLGHQFDGQAGEDDADRIAGDLESISALFFRATFAVMGCVAKADGRVSDSDIQAARDVMQRLRLSPDEVQAAIHFFREGKRPEFELERTVRELRRVCGRRHDLLRYFVEIQMSAALQGSNLQGPARAILQSTAQSIGVSALEFAHIEAILRVQSAERPKAAANAGGDLADAYQVLEIDASATDAEVTKAYRRQMSRNHPDKLVANGLPQSMMDIAKEKTQRVREAYELIRERRAMK